MVAFLTNLTVPVVAANVDVTGEPRLQGLFSKHIIKMVDGENIGIVGYTTPETAYISNPGESIYGLSAGALPGRMLEAQALIICHTILLHKPRVISQFRRDHVHVLSKLYGKAKNNVPK